MAKHIMATATIQPVPNFVLVNVVILHWLLFGAPGTAPQPLSRTVTVAEKAVERQVRSRFESLH